MGSLAALTEALKRSRLPHEACAKLSACAIQTHTRTTCIYTTESVRWRSALKSAKTVLFEFRYEFGIILKLIFCLLKSNKAQSFLRLLDGKCASNNQHEVHALTEHSI